MLHNILPWLELSKVCSERLYHNKADRPQLQLQVQKNSKPNISTVSKNKKEIRKINLFVFNEISHHRTSTRYCSLRGHSHSCLPQACFARRHLRRAMTEITLLSFFSKLPQECLNPERYGNGLRATPRWSYSIAGIGLLAK